jgi:hypothetical protein
VSGSPQQISRSLCNLALQNFAGRSIPCLAVLPLKRANFLRANFLLDIDI